MGILLEMAFAILVVGTILFFTWTKIAFWYRRFVLKNLRKDEHDGYGW